MPVVSEFRPEGVEETLDAIRRVWQAYREGIPINKELFNVYQQQRSQIYEMQRAYRALKTEFKMQHIETEELLRVLNRVGYIGRQVLHMWQSYSVAQIRVERLTRDVSDAQQEVAKWQDLVNQYLKDFGEDSAYYLDAVEHLTNAQNELTETQKRLAQAQQENIIGFAGLGLSAIGLVSQIVMVKKQFDLLNATLGVSGVSAITLLSAKLSGLAIPIGVSAYYALTLYAHWQELSDYWNKTAVPALNELGKALGLVNEKGEWLVDWMNVLKTVTEPAKESIKDMIDAFTFWTNVATQLVNTLRGLTSMNLKVNLRFELPKLEDVQWMFNLVNIIPQLRPLTTVIEQMWRTVEQTYPVPSALGAPEYVRQMLGYQAGGIIPFTAPYMMHAGERVTRAEFAAPELRNVTIYMYYPNMTSEREARDRGLETFRAFMQRLEAKA